MRSLRSPVSWISQCAQGRDEFRDQLMRLLFALLKLGDVFNSFFRLEISGEFSQYMSKAVFALTFRVWKVVKYFYELPSHAAQQHFHFSLTVIDCLSVAVRNRSNSCFHSCHCWAVFPPSFDRKFAGGLNSILARARFLTPCYILGISYLLQLVKK